MNNLIILLLTFAFLFLILNHLNKFKENYEVSTGNIEIMTLNNTNYREVISTTSNFQLVLMSLLPDEDIGAEMHPNTTQFIRVEGGQGVCDINGKKYEMHDGDFVVIPPGAKHNIMNTSKSNRLQMYVIYTPPEHSFDTKEEKKPEREDH